MIHLAKSHEEQVSVCTYDVDFSRKIKPSALLAYMQETTARHCAGTTCSREHLWGYGIFWALARIKIKVDEMPGLGDDICIKTWPRSYDKMFAYREYSIGRAGKPLVLGTSDWILMDIHTRRPCRTAKLLETGTVFPEEQEGAIDKRPGKIIAEGNVIRKLIRNVSYNDIDMYGHVNNIRYLEWALDTFTTSEFGCGQIESLQINFTAEAKDGEEVAVTRFETAPWTHIVEGNNLTTGAKSFQVMIKMRQ